MPAGRPTDYTPELGERICEVVALNPKGLPALCDEYKWFPADETIRKWRYRHPEFNGNYMRAKEFQLEQMAEVILDICDETPVCEMPDPDGGVSLRVDGAGVQRNRLRVDTRKWIMSKLAPKRFGEKSEVALSGNDGGPLELVVKHIGSDGE
jgi:hypothetical protein